MTARIFVLPHPCDPVASIQAAEQATGRVAIVHIGKPGVELVKAPMTAPYAGPVPMPDANTIALEDAKAYATLAADYLKMMDRALEAAGLKELPP